MHRIFLTLLLTLLCASGQIVKSGWTSTTNANTARGSLTDPLVSSLVLSNGITGGAPLSDLNGFAYELRKRGVADYLVDGALFHQRFNPTNNRTLRGQPITVSGAKYDGFGFQCDATNGFAFTLPNSVSNNTVVVVIKRPMVDWWGFGLYAYKQAYFALEGSDGSGVRLMEDLYVGSTVIPRSGTNWINGGDLVNGFMAPGGSNKVTFLDNDSFGYPAYTLRNVYALSSSNGVHRAWNNGNLAKFRNGADLQYNSPTVVTSALNRVAIGSSDTNWVGFINNGSGNPAQTNTFLKGSIQAVLVFNRAGDSNLVEAAYAALRWLEPSDEEVIFHGDSIMEVPESDGTRLSVQMTNSPPYFYSLLTDAVVHDYSRGGSTLHSMTNGGFTALDKSVFLLPREKVKRITIITDQGRNGQDSYSPLQQWTLFRDVYQPYVNAGARVHWISTHSTLLSSTNVAGGFSLSGLTNLATLSRMMTTNPVVSKIIDERGHVNSSITDSAYWLVTNNLFSVDGIHFNGTLSPVVNKRIAQLAYSDQWATTNGTLEVAGVFIGDATPATLIVSGTATVSGNISSTSGGLSVAGAATIGFTGRTYLDSPGASNAVLRTSAGRALAYFGETNSAAGGAYVIFPGTMSAMNGFNLPTNTAPSGITNGLARWWNSNGIVFIRTSTVGSTTEGTDKQIAP